MLDLDLLLICRLILSQLYIPRRVSSAKNEQPISRIMDIQQKILEKSEIPIDITTWKKEDDMHSQEVWFPHCVG